MVVIDSSILIDLFNGTDNKETETLSNLVKQNKKIGFNSIIMFEITSGERNEPKYQRIKKGLNNFTLFKVDHNTIIQAIEIYRQCEDVGKTISPNDCIIASSCIENDVAIFSRDQHFDFIAKITGQLKVYKD
jgi:predicted nucleic acid-binding protein